MTIHRKATATELPIDTYVDRRPLIATCEERLTLLRTVGASLCKINENGVVEPEAGVRIRWRAVYVVQIRLHPRKQAICARHLK